MRCLDIFSLEGPGYLVFPINDFGFWTKKFRLRTEIIPSIEKPWPDFKTNCIVCKAETWHDKYEKILILPKVLIVNLQRFKRGRSNRIIGKNCMNVDPSIILTLDESLYSLNAVVTHYGRTTNEGEHNWFIRYHIVLYYLEITLQSTTNLTILCMKLS